MKSYRAIISFRIGRAGFDPGQGVWTVDIGKAHGPRGILARDASAVIPLPEDASAGDLIAYVLGRSWRIDAHLEVLVDHVSIEAWRPRRDAPALAASGRESVI